MNNWQRAKISIFRQPVKTVILLVLVFVLGSLMAGAIAVTSAIESVELAARRRMPPIVRIARSPDRFDCETDPDTGAENCTDLSGEYTTEMIMEIASLDYVAHHYRSLFNWNFTNDIDWETVNVPNQSFGIGISFRGTSDFEPLEMQYGVIDLVAGHNFADHDIVSENIFPVLISSNLANVNGWILGEVITLDHPILPISFIERFFEDSTLIDWNNFKIDLNFQIVGLFDIPTNRTNLTDQGEANRVRLLSNYIFIPNDALLMADNQIIERAETLNEYYEEFDEILGPWLWMASAHLMDNNRFVLHDPLYLEMFRENALNILPDFWEVDDLSNTFAVFGSALTNMQEISTVMMVATSVAMVLILGLLILLFLYDRRHEIGVYLALGERRVKIISQIVIEVLAVALIGISCAVFAQRIFSERISQELIRNEFANQVASEGIVVGRVLNIDELFVLGFGTELTVDDALEIFGVSLSTTDVLMFYAIGMGVTLVSTMVPVLIITKMEPKKVLL